MSHFMSVDCEEWFHAADVPFDERSSLQRNVVANTMRLLELFDKYNSKSTFFILGDVAEHHPKLIELILEHGHRVASHGYNHLSLNRMTPQQFRDDLVQSKNIIEKVSGQNIDAFRAPNFSVDMRTMWALKILYEEGFAMDSSIAPIRNLRYGIPSTPRQSHRIEAGCGTIEEIPISPLRFANKFALLGGFYFRFFPLRFFQKTLERAESLGHDSCFYIHPWELSPLPHDVRIPSSTQFLRMNLGLSKTLGRLETLLQEFRFTSVNYSSRESSAAIESS